MISYSLFLLLCLVRSEIYGISVTNRDINRVTVETAQGVVEGLYETTINNNVYASFRGIPFAEPPIGLNRFKDPLPAQPWDGVLDASQQRDKCMQTRGDIGTEDCLYLNIFTPNITNDLLPVIVYVHGGAYKAGASDVGAEILVDEDVVVVAIAYRVGVFGFLSFNTADVPGNAGMKDQVMALKWVNENIKKFGGDPNDVTIMGISAGAASVSHLQVSPLAKGLFHKVVAKSGVSLCPWAVQDYPEKVVDKLATVLSFKSENKADVLNYLRNVPANELVQAADYVEADPGGLYEDLQYAPVIEQEFEGVDAFLLKTPLEYIYDGEASDVPLILGYASKEYVSFYEEDMMLEYINDDRMIVPNEWRQMISEDDVKTVATAIRNFYFNSQSFDINNREHLFSGIDLLGDIMFAIPIIEAAEIFANNLQSPVYLYRFTHRGALNHGLIEYLGIQAATHGDDKTYLLQEKNTEVEEYSSDWWVRIRLRKLFTNFAKSGNPTPGPRDQILPIVWNPFTKDDQNYLEINEELIPSLRTDEIKFSFWTNLKKTLRSGELI